MITLTAGEKSFTAENFSNLADQIMREQDFGSYPIWQFNDDFEDFNADEEELGLTPGWQRFDGATAPGKDAPVISEEEILAYARWSLEVEDISISVN